MFCMNMVTYEFYVISEKMANRQGVIKISQKKEHMWWMKPDRAVDVLTLQLLDYVFIYHYITLHYLPLKKNQHCEMQVKLWRNTNEMFSLSKWSIFSATPCLFC